MRVHLRIDIEYDAANETAARYIEGRLRADLLEQFPDAFVSVRPVTYVQIDELRDERSAA